MQRGQRSECSHFTDRCAHTSKKKDVCHIQKAEPCHFAPRLWQGACNAVAVQVPARAAEGAIVRVGKEGERKCSHFVTVANDTT
jgi:hypothetical protein